MAKPQIEHLPAEPYEPTKREAVGLEAFERRRKARAPVPSMKAHSKKQPTRLEPDHPDPSTAYKLILESIGTSDGDFAQVVMTQLGKLSIPSVVSAYTVEAVNAGLTFVRGVRPQDETEAMLATQMAAIHMATMTAAARLSNTTDGTWIEIHEKALNKLARTFTTQIEALKRYRSKGEQRVYVERVTVNDGGQAIVGPVSHGGGVGEKNEG